MKSLSHLWYNRDMNDTTYGISFMGALQLLFIGLKLGHVIEWTWWKVLLPIEVDLVVTALFLSALGVTKLIATHSHK